ncbi:hypothetical protein J6590_057012 [Homalodisca vitripennis]|nr:hypothetical protein J6590_057012 [Homalodisca vitripennis]
MVNLGIESSYGQPAKSRTNEKNTVVRQVNLHATSFGSVLESVTVGKKNAKVLQPARTRSDSPVAEDKVAYVRFIVNIFVS